MLGIRGAAIEMHHLLHDFVFFERKHGDAFAVLSRYQKGRAAFAHLVEMLLQVLA